MSWTVTALSSVSSDTEPTLVVAFDSAKYIFNVGENTTRAFLQSRTKWRKAKALFLSDLRTQRSSGLPGLLMGLADNGITKLDVVGPSGLSHLLATYRTFVFRTMTLKHTEIPLESGHRSASTDPSPSAPVYADDNITVFAVSVTPPREGEEQNSGTAVLESSHSLKRKRDASPESHQPAKRHSSTYVATRDEELVSGSDSLRPGILSERMRRQDFSPFALLSHEAQTWRRWTIDRMFGTNNPCETWKNFHNYLRLPKLRSFMEDDLNPSTQMPHGRSRATVSSYIIHGPQPRGKFDAKKADSLGLKPGRLRGRVAKGETVEVKFINADGREETRMVGPEDCIGPSPPATACCIIDCPDPSYIDGLIASPIWRDYGRERRDKTTIKLGAMFHVLGDGVLEDERYVNWMNTFDEDVRHQVAHPKYCPDPVTFSGAAYYQLRLQQLDSKIFPLPYYDLNIPSDLKSVPNLPVRTCPLVTNLEVNMRDFKVTSNAPSEQDDFHCAIEAATPLQLPAQLLQEFTRVKQSITNGSQGLVELPDDVEIIPLGTSSATPSKYRNVSGMYVRIPNHGGVMLDCGEASCAQIQRHFGNRPGSYTAADAVRDLRCVFISHMHGDHHIGLSRLLAKRRMLDPKPTHPLYIVAPYGVHLYLNEFSELEDLGIEDESSGAISILNDSLLSKTQKENGSPDGQTRNGRHDGDIVFSDPETAIRGLRASLGLESLQTVDVIHRGRCFGLVMKHIDGWSLVYSGDTVPAESLVRAGQNATILIHEATFSNDETETAKKKGHCTIGQAIDIGRRMHARNTLLTHFSARYPKMPQSKQDATSPHGPTLAVAMDNACIPLHSMWKLNMYLPALEQNFADLADDSDARISVAVE